MLEHTESTMLLEIYENDSKFPGYIAMFASSDKKNGVSDVNVGGINKSDTNSFASLYRNLVLFL